MITLLLLVRATYMYGVVLHAHPVRGESHNQRNTTGEVATTQWKFWTGLGLQKSPIRSTLMHIQTESCDETERIGGHSLANKNLRTTPLPNQNFWGCACTPASPPPTPVTSTDLHFRRYSHLRVSHQQQAMAHASEFFSLSQKSNQTFADGVGRFFIGFQLREKNALNVNQARPTNRKAITTATLDRHYANGRSTIWLVVSYDKLQRHKKQRRYLRKSVIKRFLVFFKRTMKLHENVQGI